MRPSRLRRRRDAGRGAILNRAVRAEHAVQAVTSKVEGINHPYLNVGRSRAAPTPTWCRAASFKLDRRMIPEENPAEVEATLRRIIEDGAAKQRFPASRSRSGACCWPTPCAPARQRAAGAGLQKHGEQVFGEKIPALGTPLYTDVRLFCEAGIPGVIYGAGPRTVLESQRQARRRAAGARRPAPRHQGDRAQPARQYADLDNIGVGISCMVLITILLIARFGKGFCGQHLGAAGHRASGGVIGAAMGKMDFHKVAQAQWFDIVTAVPDRHADLRPGPDPHHDPGDDRGDDRIHRHVPGPGRDDRQGRSPSEDLKRRPAHRWPGHADRRHLQHLPLHQLLAERGPGGGHRRQEPLGLRGRRRDPDHAGRAAQDGGAGGIGAHRGARRRRPGDVRHGRRHRHPHPVQGGLPDTTATTP
jgi:hypothetical protein